MCWNVVMFSIHNCGYEALFQTSSQLFGSFTIHEVRRDSRRRDAHELSFYCHVFARHLVNLPVLVRCGLALPTARVLEQRTTV